MIRRDFGNTGLRVTPLGFGAMQVGDPAIDEGAAARMLHGALDLGIGLIDTARSYGLSEGRIGRHLASRRDEFVLSTKVGYGIDGVADWTYDCVMAGVDAARDRLRTDVIDIVHLHSCPLEVLERYEVTRALARCRELGKLRVAAYSGDDAALAFAVRSGAFQSVQASLSICDQQSAPVLRDARARGLGVLAKRVFAGRPWAPASGDADQAHREYRQRYAALAAAGLPQLGDWDATALRFAASTPAVDCVLVGGSNLAHLARNVAVVEDLGAGTGIAGESGLGDLAGSVATGGGLAKSLLGNRFVGQPPSVRAAADSAEDVDATATPARRGGSGGVSANKAIPEERLGRHPSDSSAAAHAERLGRYPLDTGDAAHQERLGRYPLDTGDAAHQQRLGRHPSDSSAAAQSGAAAHEFAAIHAAWQRVGADWRGLI